MGDVCIQVNITGCLMCPSILSTRSFRRQHPKQKNPELPLPGYLYQFIQEDTEAFPGELRDIIPPALPTPGETLNAGEAPNECPNQVPKLPLLSPLNVEEEQQLYSKLLADDRAPDPVSQ